MSSETNKPITTSSAKVKTKFAIDSDTTLPWENFGVHGWNLPEAKIKILSTRHESSPTNRNTTCKASTTDFTQNTTKHKKFKNRNWITPSILCVSPSKNKFHHQKLQSSPEMIGLATENNMGYYVPNQCSNSRSQLSRDQNSGSQRRPWLAMSKSCRFR